MLIAEGLLPDQKVPTRFVGEVRYNFSKLGQDSRAARPYMFFKMLLGLRFLEFRRARHRRGEAPCLEDAKEAC